MTEAEWQASDKVYPLQAFLSESGIGSNRKLRLFTVACCRHVFAYGNGELGDLLLANEAFAHGLLSDEEFEREWITAMAVSRRPTDGPAEGVWTAIAGEGNPLRVRASSTAMYSGDSALGAVLPESLSEDMLLNEGIAAHPEGQRYFEEVRYQASLIRDIFGNPFRPVAFPPDWRTVTAVALAKLMYDSRDFGAMPILADALQDAGCESDDILNHCRDLTVIHVRGCWVVDLLLGKQ